jgi:hypothetical protein
MGQGTQTAQSYESPLTRDEQWELVLRVANSRGFSHSVTLRSFLLYVAEQAIAGRLDALKEQQIGWQVLGRKPDYDPVEDNIVRVRARQLRKKVEDYFANEGVGEPVVLSIPKGHYIPLFQPKSPGGARAPIEVAKPKLARRLSIPVAAPWVAVPWIVAALSLSILLVVLWRQRTAKAPIAPETPAARIAHGVWGQLLSAPDHEITVVTADAGFALWQDLTRHTVSLGEYLSRRYLRDETTNPDLREIAVRRHTSSADLNVTLRLAETARSFGGRLKVKFARNVDVHELRTGNVVLLGSRRSNPWVQLFESQLNFSLSDEASLSGPSFRNKSPKPGEPKVFSISSPLEVKGAEDSSMESYAVAALLPSPSGTGVVAIVEGLSMEGTEAAGELVTNLEKFGTLLRRIGVKNDQPVKPFEMLLKLTAVPGGYGDAELIAYRYPVP